MRSKKVLCAECRNRVSFRVIKKQMEHVIKGENYTYMGKEAYCSKCGAEVYVDDVIDFNLEKLYDAYRKENDIISLEKVLEISDFYTDEQMTIVKGWRKGIFDRYCEGDVPSKEHSDDLKQIYELLLVEQIRKKFTRRVIKCRK